VLSLLDFDTKFNKIRDLYILFLVIMFVLQPFSAFFGNLVLLSSSIIESSEFFQSLFSWWFGNVMGQFLVTPLVLLVYINYKDINKIKFIVYGLYFAILNYVLICVLMIDNLALLLGIIVPLVMLLGRYEGLNYTLFAILMIALTSLYTTKLDYGIFSNGTPIDNLININFYILAHILISLINGILFIEKEILAKKLMLLNTNLSTIVEKEVQKNKQKDYFLIQQSRLAQMGEMISMIAHQWKQPLNNLSIINQALVLKYKRDKLDDAAIDKFKKDSNSQIQQMNNTINDFRDFFKPDKELKRVNVLDTVKTTLEIANPMLAHSNINIDIDIKNDIFVSIYPNEFNQVILNILNNARDALDENNIANKKIFINLQEKDNQVMLNIQDNAGGIPEEIIEEIFNPYFSTKDSKKGTGLGLYMSRLIIEEHMDGKLDASNINDGAKFTIVLNKE
jgi:signal transduction histidine kinase